MASEDPSPQPARKVAEAPYSDPHDADLIIRTSDGVDFYVHKFLLSLVSPVFKDMFSLPQPFPTGHASESDELPSINVEEDAQTLEALLAFIDPRVVYPDLDLSFEVAFDVALAVEKYQMDVVMKKLEPTLSNPPKDPIPAFLKASPFAEARDWARIVVRTAAVASLATPISSVLRTSVNTHSAGDLCRLIQFHVLCGDRSADAVRGLRSKLSGFYAHYQTGKKHAFKHQEVDFPACNCSGKERCVDYGYHDSQGKYWLERHYVYQYRELVSTAVSSRPLDAVNPDVRVSVLEGRETRFELACLGSMMLKYRDQFRQLNEELMEVVSEAIEEVDLGYTENCMPFVSEKKKEDPLSSL